MKLKHQKFLLKYRFLIVALIVVLVVGFYNVWKPMPKEIDASWGSRYITENDVVLLTDTTYTNKQGERVYDQQIFDAIIKMINRADSYIFIDMFLWNSFGASASSTHRALSSELTSALIAKKKQNNTIVIQVVSDPINSVYGGQDAPLFDAMKKAGIKVTFTDLPSLRDSNPIFSTIWRLVFYPLDMLHLALTGTTYTFRLLPNIVNSTGDPVTLRSYAGLLNFKANHRKLIVADGVYGGVKQFATLVTSANPHDGSSAHSNIGFMVYGDLAYDVLKSEKRIVTLGGGEFIEPPLYTSRASTTQSAERVRLVTDRAIRDNVIATLAKTSKGDTIDMLMFYLSDIKVIEELIKASHRGVTIRIILDPNKDAFGRQKNGIPNRQVAKYLTKEGRGNITIRWCDTHGEQCHAKLLSVTYGTTQTIFAGSANFTRRNIGGYNLETNLMFVGSYNAQHSLLTNGYFNDVWNNTRGVFSAPYEKYRDESFVKAIIAYIMEVTGLSTF